MNITSLSVWPSGAPGEFIVTVPITCTGPDADATIKLFIYEGSVLPTHGTLLAAYGQDLHFLHGERKDVQFRHKETATSQSRRDVGVQVVVGGEVVASDEFDDVYSAPTSGDDMMGMMMPMLVIGMMVMMVGQLMPAMTGE